MKEEIKRATGKIIAKGATKGKKKVSACRVVFKSGKFVVSKSGISDGI